jgi:hypothetical protein
MWFREDGLSVPRRPQLWYPPTIGKLAALQQTLTRVETAPDTLSEKPPYAPLSYTPVIRQGLANRKTT